MHAMAMAMLFKNWFEHSFSNPQVVVLFFLLLLGVFVISFASDILAPLIISLVIAYLLDGVVGALRRYRISPFISMLSVYILFISVLLFVLIFMLPMMTLQIADFLQDLPAIIERGQALLLQLPQSYPQFVDENQITEFISSLRNEISGIAQAILSTLLTSLAGFITVLVYLVLVPLLIFFFLKDKEQLLKWCSAVLPRKENRDLTLEVWREVNQKISGYIRGKMIEIVIVWIVSWVVFQSLGLQYAALLSLLVGLSVVIPFLGAAVVTIPIAMVAYAQWGLTSDFLYLMVAYAVIQFLDGNLLVPLLFSEIVNLHPVAIISAILIFGGIWGIWGVFFAIPLATLVNAVLRVWLATVKPVNE